MARNASGKGELLEQPLHTICTRGNVRIELAIGAFQIGVRDQARSTVARTCDVNDVQSALLYQPIEVNIDEIQPRSCAPMAQQARLDVSDFQSFTQEWVFVQIDLPDGEGIGGPHA